ncbi:hypothetical protein [Nocardia sp. CA-290969]|uniref:hypothetical protein n=1 Tax=Nocardia sp. CA-290969 TaxID=3239986 RepID=UPI003D8F3845
MKGDLVGPEFAVSLLVFGFLELCVQRCSDADAYDPNSEEVSDSIAQFAEVVSGCPYDMVLARYVSHLVPDGELEINGVTIVPDKRRDLTYRILKEIPDADHAWKRFLATPGRRPHALLIVRRSVSGVGYHGEGDLRRLLDRFQLGVCLLTGANVLGMYQVSGSSSRISGRPANLDHLARNTHTPLTRRTARLDGTEGSALAALGNLIATAESKTGSRDHWLSSFREALKKFANLDDTTSYSEQLVDLATALEGVILGTNEGEGLTLRLCTRVTALLAHEDDPAPSLFEDLKRLYGFRSTIVHGGEAPLRTLRKDLKAMECVASVAGEENELIQLGYAVDRLRDIVRRAILARICLAAGDEPPWPFKEKGQEKVKVDTALSDDATRAVWRSHWRDMLASLGAGAAASRSLPPVVSVSAEDR